MAEQEKKEEARRRLGHWMSEETRQHLKAARAEWRESMKSLFPPEFVTHRQAARREALLAARSLIDHALKRIAEDEKA